jgi:hypothetical protein
MARRSDEILVAKNAAAHSSPIEFVHRWLLSSHPFAFRAVDGSYPEFKAELATRLQVHAAEMTIVGSAQLGFSLNPSQLLRRFRRESDIDVVIVSSAVFDGTI